MVKSKWNGEEVKTIFYKHLRRGLTKATTKVESDSILTSPVDTGDMRSDHHTLIDYQKLIGYIFNSKDYAPKVHEGTTRQNAQPWMRDSLNRNKDIVLKIIGKSGSDAIKEIITRGDRVKFI